MKMKGDKFWISRFPQIEMYAFIYFLGSFFVLGHEFKKSLNEKKDLTQNCMFI